MHIHGSFMDMNASGLCSTAAAEKAAATKRAADVRRKLMKSATDIEGISTPDEAYMVSKWMEPLHNQPQKQTQGEDHSASVSKDLDLG